MSRTIEDRRYGLYAPVEVIAVQLDSLCDTYADSSQMVRLRGILDDSPQYKLCTGWMRLSDLSELIFPEEDTRAKN